MNTSSHVSLEVLTEIAENRVGSEAGEAAMAHISMCPICDETLIRLREVMRMMRNDKAEDAPQEVLTSALNVFSRGTKPPLRRFAAVLTFDSRSARPAFGMRSTHMASRQRLYSSPDTDLDLRITVQNEECILSGQLLKESCGGGVVEISGATASVETGLNKLCEFTLPAVPFGTYSLTIKMVDVEIEVPELELKA